MFVLSRSCGFWVKKPFWGTLLLCDESQGDDNTWQEDLAVLKPLYPILCLNSSHVKDISIMFPWQKQYLNCSLRSLIIYCLWHKIYIFIIFISSRNSYIHIFPPPSIILHLPNKREWNNWLLKTPPPPPPKKNGEN